ncbi:MAG: hypothetical protein ACLS3C_11725 [Oscillospiraceae bacterium]
MLGLGLPVLYASNACAEGIGFDFRQASSATLASLAGLDLKAGMDASFLPAYEVLFQSSIPETDSMTVSADALDAFLSGEQGLYYGSTADAADVQTQLARTLPAVRRAAAGACLYAPERLVGHAAVLQKGDGLRRALPVVPSERGRTALPVS